MCKKEEERGKINLETLLRVDGEGDGTCLWICGAPQCEKEGLLKGRETSFFIPSIEKLERIDKNNTHSDIVMFGSLFIPCSLSFSLYHGSPDISSKTLINTSSSILSFEDECLCFVNLTHSQLEPQDGKQVFLYLLSSSSSSSSSSLPFFLVSNGEGGNSTDGRLSLGGNLEKEKEGGGNVLLIILVVILFVLSIGVGVVIVLLYLKYSHCIHRLEEEKRKRSESTTKENGTKMGEKENVWKPESMNADLLLTGTITRMKEEDEKDEYNYTSTTSLLPNKVEYKPMETETETEKKRT
jgi:hypothetical protein